MDQAEAVAQEHLKNQIEIKMKLEHYQALAYAIETDSNLKFENYQLDAEKCINELRRKI